MKFLKYLSNLNRVYVIRFYYVRTGGQILTVLYSSSTVRTIISNNDRQYCRLLKLKNKAVKAFIFFYHVFNPLNKCLNKTRICLSAHHCGIHYSRVKPLDTLLLTRTIVKMPKRAEIFGKPLRHVRKPVECVVLRVLSLP